MAEEDGAGFEVTRFIPVPRSVSDHAQQFLATGFSIGGDGSQKEPEPDDIEGWRAVIKVADDALIAVTEMLPPVPASTVA